MVSYITELAAYKADPRLMWAIIRTLGREPKRMEDLQSMLSLHCDATHPAAEQGRIPLEEGNFHLVGEMSGLVKLDISERLHIQNYEFLSRLKALKKLTLYHCNFTDATPLLGLPELREVNLDWCPLEHPEVLDELRARGCQVRNSLPGPAPAPVEIIPPSAAPEEECLEGPYYAHFLKYPEKKGEPSVQGLQELRRLILEGELRETPNWKSVYACLEEGGPSILVDFKHGWSTLMVLDEENGAYWHQHNLEEPDEDEPARVEAGGQSPVPRKYASQDMELTWRSILCFVKTGGLYSGAEWHRYDW